MVGQDDWDHSGDVDLCLGELSSGISDGSVAGGEEGDVEVWVTEVLVQASQTDQGSQACNHSRTRSPVVQRVTVQLSPPCCLSWLAWIL